jgi:uncharacterized iron-regulated membrane protein
MAGCLAGAVILIMSVTGMLLAYERQILSLVDREARLVAPSSASPLALDYIFTRYMQSTGAVPTGITLRSDPTAAVEMNFGRERIVYLNPYSGAKQGENSKTSRIFFERVTSLHRWLGGQGDSKAIGRSVTGACNLLFVFLVASGVVLWWPRRLKWRNLKPIILFRKGHQGRARDWNLHHIVGFWFGIPLFAIATTGVVMSYSWANNLVYTLTGSEVPRPNTPSNRDRPRIARLGGTRETEKFTGFDRLFLAVQREIPAWKTINFQIPRSSQSAVTASVDETDNGRPDRRSQLTLDRMGRILECVRFENNSPGRRLRIWMRFVHTGEAGGLIGQTTAAFACGAAVVLVWTGISLAIRRLFRFRSKRPTLRLEEAVVRD